MASQCEDLFIPLRPLGLTNALGLLHGGSFSLAQSFLSGSSSFLRSCFLLLCLAKFCKSVGQEY